MISEPAPLRILMLTTKLRNTAFSRLTLLLVVWCALATRVSCGSNLLNALDRQSTTSMTSDAGKLSKLLDTFQQFYELPVPFPSAVLAGPSGEDETCAARMRKHPLVSPRRLEGAECGTWWSECAPWLVCVPFELQKGTTMRGVCQRAESLIDYDRACEPGKGQLKDFIKPEYDYEAFHKNWGSMRFPEPESLVACVETDDGSGTLRKPKLPGTSCSKDNECVLLSKSVVRGQCVSGECRGIDDGMASPSAAACKGQSLNDQQDTCAPNTFVFKLVGAKCTKTSDCFDETFAEGLIPVSCIAGQCTYDQSQLLDDGTECPKNKPFAICNFYCKSRFSLYGKCASFDLSRLLALHGTPCDECERILGSGDNCDACVPNPKDGGFLEGESCNLISSGEADLLWKPLPGRAAMLLWTKVWPCLQATFPASDVWRAGSITHGSIAAGLPVSRPYDTIPVDSHLSTCKSDICELWEYHYVTLRDPRLAFFGGLEGVMTTPAFYQLGLSLGCIE